MQSGDMSETLRLDAESTSRLVYHAKTAVGFHDRPIPPETLRAILGAVTPHASLSKWRLLAITEKEERLRLLETVQAAYVRIEKTQWAKVTERWKPAPVILSFWVPRDIPPFGGVPPDVVEPLARIEMGMGIQNLTLLARAYGVETHWIAGTLLVADTLKSTLKIPEEYDLALVGVAGYPSEEVDEEFPPFDTVCAVGSW